MKGQQVFALPELPESWTETLDSLRAPRERDEPPWEWRKRPPQPVVFRPLERIGEERVHLHLEHPFIQRILSRFRSQGYSARDLSRVTVVPNPHDALVRVIAFGRVSLFGPGAARLHDELVSVAAQWLEAGDGAHLKPFADEADRRAVETLEKLFQEAQALGAVPDNIQARLIESAPQDFATLWQAVKEEAEDRAHRATQLLSRRGQVHSRVVYVQIPDSAPSGVVGAFREALDVFGIGQDVAEGVVDLRSVAETVGQLADRGLVVVLDEFQYFSRQKLSDFSSHVAAKGFPGSRSLIVQAATGIPETSKSISSQWTTSPRSFASVPSSAVLSASPARFQS